jgi:hypothetical protein
MDGADIRRELLAMAEQDIRVRSELAADGSLFKGYHPRMQAVHDANAARLAEILIFMGGRVSHWWAPMPRRPPGSLFSTRLLILGYSGGRWWQSKQPLQRAKRLPFTRQCWKTGFAASRGGLNDTVLSSTGMPPAR